MAARLPLPAFSAFVQPVERRAACKYTSTITPRKQSPTALHPFSTTSLRQDEMDVERAERPRWQATPERMVAPFRSRPRPLNNEHRVNEDPQRLDQVYIRVLGNGGERVLTDEAKWLAVTHKSFDHGRRGYNDRLAFLGRTIVFGRGIRSDAVSYIGKRIVDLQTSLAMIRSASPHPQNAAPDPHGRTPFGHPALEGLDALSSEAKLEMTDRRRLAQIAEGYGLAGVIRWKPRQVGHHPRVQFGT